MITENEVENLECLRLFKHGYTSLTELMTKIKQYSEDYSNEY